jgi:adenylosuccinate lyase
MLAQFTKIVDELLVYPEHMQANIDRTHGLIYSQDVMLALTQKGLKREEAYRVVQDEAMNVWKSGQSFRDLLERRQEVTKHLSKNDLDQLFDPKRGLAHVDYIFKRVGLS